MIYDLNNYTNDLNDLNKYMFDNFDITYENKIINNNNINNNDENKNIKKPNIYINYNKNNSKYNEKPDYIYEDKLFWFYYQLYNNITDEDLIATNKFTLEKQTKILIMKEMKNHNTIIKMYKIKKSILEDSLLDKKPINIYTFWALCVIYNIKLIVILEKIYFTTIPLNFNIDNDINNDIDNDIDNNIDDYIFVELKYNIKNKTNYLLKLNISKNEKLEKLNKYYISNLLKPLPSLSSIKLPELYIIANKLDISLIDIKNKKKTKLILYKELYDLIYKIKFI